ncbi:hypothetical protein T484DRAFT_1776376 [Baffinella frigidus]|nr:hypothetical protein T484DRAFT_1776376 [Cryptophyta sp. CCMP2293]
MRISVGSRLVRKSECVCAALKNPEGGLTRRIRHQQAAAAAAAAVGKGQVAGSSGGVQDELRKLKDEYVGAGGRDPSMLEAIRALETEITSSTAMRGSNPAHHAAHRAEATVNRATGNKGGTLLKEGTGNKGGTPPEEDPMQGLDAAIRRQEEENAKLEREVDRMMRAKGLEGGEGAAGKGGGHGVTPLMEEEDELRKLESLPKDSSLYQMRKKHLEEMLSLKYEAETLKQEAERDDLTRQVDAMKKEHERSEWIQTQQQQLLEVERELEKRQAEDPSSAEYSPEEGFVLYFDFVVGLPIRVQKQVQISYCFYQGGNPWTVF